MEKRLSRKLAAIFYADVAGYSRLTGEDEEGTHQRLSSYLDLISQSIRNHNGKVIHYAGDAILADFKTVTDALTSAAQIQIAIKDENAGLPDERKLQFRIGVNLGEVIVDRNDIYGDGVNVAARLETLAEPGGICISHAVRAAAGNKLPFGYHDIGKQKVKNIEEPVLAYQVLLENNALPYRRRKFRASRFGIVAAVATLLLILPAVLWLTSSKVDEKAESESTAELISDQPSIAVLPFQTLSEDPNQDYFSDGVTNDIITDLSKFSNLLVIASNSVFVYKNKPANIKEIGRELGVRYVLEGSIQKAGNRVRINAQLIDATTDRHLWAERYDFELGDVFKVQDEITSTVVTSLQVVLTEDEKNLSATSLTNVIEAYDLFLRGRTYLRGTRKAHLKARELFNQAIKLDPEFAAAYAEKSFTYFSSFIMPMTRDSRVVKSALLAAERAVELDDTLPLAFARLSWAYLSNRQHAKAVAAARRAVALGPNDAEANAQLGNILNWAGKPEEGRQYVDRAIRLNPHYPYYYLFYLGQSYYLTRDNEKAIELMKRVVTRAPNYLPVRRHLAVLYSENGMIEEAKKQTREVLRIFPGASIADSRARCFYRWTPEILKRFFKGLRQSGMPEGKVGVEPISM